MLLPPRAILRSSINMIRVVAGADPLDDDTSIRSELKQAGQIVVIFAVMLTVLIGLVGIAVDTTYAWREALRVQRASDAAALAGVVYLPGDFATAQTTALAEAGMNGFGGSAVTAIAVSRASNPNELDVTVTTQVPTFFSRIFGINTFSVARSSRAIYVLPVPMGSPENYYGSFGPYKVNSTNTALVGPNGEAMNSRGFWGSELTQGAGTSNGDAYMPKFNSASQTGTNPNPQDSADFYNYGIYMPPGTSGGHVYVFDPEFCATDGIQGTGDRWFSGTNKVSLYYDLYNTNNQPYNTAAHTLLGGSGSLFTNMSAGDPSEGYGGTLDTTPPYTSSSVLQCKHGTTYTPITAAQGSAAVGNDGMWRNYHDKWWDLTAYLGITLSGGATGQTYRLHTYTDPGNTSQDSTNGTNDFSIFATGTGGSPQVYGIGAMQMYTPLPASTTSTFYLAQISQSAGAGKTIEISLWDPGDTGNLTADLSILQPTAAGWSSINFTYTARKVASDAANCTSGSGSVSSVRTASGGSHYFNGCWLTINVVIPASYTAPQSGWWKIQYAMTGGSGNSTDETTWQVNIRGNPVHLI